MQLITALVSWPPCGDRTICRAAEAWGEKRPIIYIGEPRGGRNAPEEFFNAFQVIEGLEFPLKSWHGFYDNICTGYYKIGSRHQANVTGTQTQHGCVDAAEDHHTDTVWIEPMHWLNDEPARCPQPSLSNSYLVV